MGSEQSISPADISNTKVFNYEREVIVELHGRTTGGEFEVISYTFTTDTDNATRLNRPEIPSAHEDLVREALSETDFTLE